MVLGFLDDYRMNHPIDVSGPFREIKLTYLAFMHNDSNVRAYAAMRISDDQTLGMIASSDSSKLVRAAALSRISNVEMLREAALRGRSYEEKRAAIDRFAQLLRK
jgi:hypothetical protein